MRRALVFACAVIGCGEPAAVLGADASSADASLVDASTVHDATADAAPEATPCGPPDIASFVPPPYAPPTGAYQGLCTLQQVDAYFTACLAVMHTQASCAAISGPSASSADRACAACILSKGTDAYGPLISHAGVMSINVAGCMALLDPNGGASCARAYQIESACEDFMCTYVPCPVEWCNFGCYPACVQSVQRGACAPFASAAACADVEADAGAVLCLGAMTFEEYYARIVPLFCGTRPSDASTE